MGAFTSLYAIVYAIMNSMENISFDKDDYFHLIVFYTGFLVIKELVLPNFHFNFSFSQTSTRVTITVCKYGKSVFYFLNIKLSSLS